MAKILQPIILEERIEFASIRLESLTPLMIAIHKARHEIGNPKYTLHDERQGLINFHKPYPAVTWELMGNQCRVNIYNGGDKQETYRLFDLITRITTYVYETDSGIFEKDEEPVDLEYF